MKIGIWAINGWEKDYLASQLKDYDIDFFSHNLIADTLPEDKGYEVISVFVGSDINKTVINHFKHLKLITTRSTGFDHIDITAAKKRDISIAYVPTYGENTVAEHAFALLLTLSHRVYEAYDRLREQGEYSFVGLEGFDLKDKTIGILGTGNIGKYAIKIANGFSMNVIAFDAFPNPKLELELNFSYRNNLEDLLRESDAVSIHIPYLESTHHLINRDNIFKMKKGAVLINTARGPIVETEALIKALKEEHLAGAGLDVLEEEGILKDEMGHLLKGTEVNSLKLALENHILIDMPNVIITPHSAFNTKEAKTRILDTTIDNITSFAMDRKLPNPVPIK